MSDKNILIIPIKSGQNLMLIYVTVGQIVSVKI
jgi:hypothetical protein